MSPAALVDHLRAAGIRLGVAGDALHADVLPGADLTRHTPTIQANRPALIAEFRLRRQIVACVEVAPDAFDRGLYDALWARWYALQEENPS